MSEFHVGHCEGVLSEFTSTCAMKDRAAWISAFRSTFVAGCTMSKSRPRSTEKDVAMMKQLKTEKLGAV